MTYTFSWTSFIIGFMILCAGGAVTLWHRQLADMFGGGVGSYSRYQLYGLIACGVGIVVMVNLHELLLLTFFSLFFGGNR
jgi:hypothetical protein cdiviTM7_02192